MTQRRSNLLLLAASLGAAPWAAAQPVATAQFACAPIAIAGHYGPFDYVYQRNALVIVETAHFTSQVESLRGGIAGFLGHDISYTLNASPNHHRALLAAMRYSIREKKDQPPHMSYSTSCYFDRATRFRPKDTVVRGLYAKYLLDFMRQKDEALRQVNVAVEFAGDNPLTHHNAGMLYFEMGEFVKAAERAVRARELGYPREDLIDKLRSVNHWAVTSPSPAASSSVPPTPQNP